MATSVDVIASEAVIADLDIGTPPAGSVGPR
jgi:hypothetical protein